MKNEIANVTWDENGLPHSTLFDDKYFCQENGLAESQYIFCEGNRLEERWNALSAENTIKFTIAETGFGSGLNFLCAWKLWKKCSPKNSLLHYISIDQYPLSPEDLSKSLKIWPTLNHYSDQLVKYYSSGRDTSLSTKNNQIQQLYFDEKSIKLTLIFDHVLGALDNFPKNNPVDAWFLDGFAPSKNPEMWSDEVFSHVADLSHKGTTFATFTVAGFVRRGLNNQGFTTIKTKGFGKKRQMLQGIFK